jgi:hypothetical protein
MLSEIQYVVRFEVLMVVKIQVQVFWVVTLKGVDGGSRVL